MGKPPVQAERKKELLDQITSTDIDLKEIVEYVEVYFLKELADIFIAQNKILKVFQILQMSNVVTSTSFWVCNWRNILENTEWKYW